MPSNVLMFEFLAVDHFGPVAEHVSKKLDGVGERMGAIGKTAAFAIGKVAVGGLAAFGYEMVKGVQAAANYQTLQLKTAAVIKSTGNQAHLTVRGIDELAHSLQETSGVSETLIINSENVLATFTNIRNATGKNNDIYNQATSRILDLSVAMGEDLQTATVQVGKALNDPLKGMTALQRIGVSFNTTQKEQIKHLVNTGHLMDAQKIILKELGKEFGGAAKAAGSGFGGAMARVKLAVEDSFRSMGMVLLPVLTKVANWFADKLPGAIAATGRGFAVLGGWLAMIGQKYGPPLLLFFRNVSTTILQLAQRYGPTILAFLMRMGLALQTLALKVGPILLNFFRALVPIVRTVATVVGGYLATGIGIVVHYFRDLLFPALRDAGAKIFPQLRAAVATIGAAFRDHMDVIRAFGQVFLFILKVLGVALAALALILVKVVIPVIAELIVIVLSAVGPIVRALLSITGVLITVIKGIAAFAVTAVKMIANVIGDIIGAMSNAGKWVNSAARSIANGIKMVIGAIANIIGDIIGAYSNAGKWLLSAGQAIIGGLIRGIQAVWPHILTAIGHTVDILLGPFKPVKDWLVGTGKDLFVGFLKGVAGFASTVVKAIGGFIHDKLIGPFSAAIGWLDGAGRNLLVGFLKGVAGYAATILKAINIFIHDKLIGPFSAAVGWLVSSGRNVLVGLWHGIVSVNDTLHNKIMDVIARVKAPFSGAIDFLKTAGGHIIGGMLSGITSAMSNIRSWIHDHIVQPVIDWVKWFFGISSPSRIFATIGVNLIAGLINGLRSMIGKLGQFERDLFHRLVGFFAGAGKWLWNAGFNVLWGFWQGLKAIWNNVTGWIGGIATWIKNNKGPISLDGRLLIPAGRAIMQGFLTGLKSGAGHAWSFVKSVGGKTKEALAEALGYIPGVGWLSKNVKFGNPSNIKGFSPNVSRWAGIVLDALRTEGLSTSLLPRVLTQLNTESGGNPNAINLWDSNAKAGTPSKGLMQVIDPTFRAYHWPGTSNNIYDPIANIFAALNYARHAYGPNLSALGQGHGYDTGGLARGAGWWRKGPLPERILSPRQTAWFERAMAAQSAGRAGRAGGHGGITVVLNAPNYVGSRRELLDEFNRFARLGQMDAIVRMATR